MDVKAKLRHLRQSPRKVRLVANTLRGLNVGKALDQLRFIGKRAATPLRKLVDSAIANALNNFSLDKDNLYIKELRVDEGPALKRWTSRAFGRASQIKKRTSHIILVLGERIETVASKTAVKKSDIVETKIVKSFKEAKEKLKEAVSEDEDIGGNDIKKEKKEDKKEGLSADRKKSQGKKGSLRRIFQRKSGQ